MFDSNIQNLKSINAPSVKGQILRFILPMVAIGLVILAVVSIKSMGDSFEREITSSASITTKEISDEVSEWLDMKLLETQLSASNPVAKSMEIDRLNLNNQYRYNLLSQKYPGVYDSVSWAPLDGSGVTYGVSSDGVKVMQNQEKAWYKEAMTGSQDAFMTSPVISQASGKIIFNSIAKIKNDAGQNAGIILAAINVDAVTKKITDFKLGESGYNILISRDGTYIVHPDSSRVMKQNIMQDDNPSVRELGQKMLSGSSGTFEFEDPNLGEMIAFYNPIQASGWGVATVSRKSELLEPISTGLKLTIIISAALLIVIFVGITITVDKITAPLRVMIEELHLLAEGDFSNRPIEVNTENELGLLSSAVKDMRSEVSKVLQSVSNSSLSLSNSAEKLNTTTDQSATVSNQISESIERVAAGTNQQLNAVNAASTAIEDLNETIQKVATEADAAAEQSKTASKIAMEGGQILEDTLNQIRSIETSSKESSKAMASLGERSESISNIVGTIAGIASQTNLLALNAAIEAARAGEAGKGFAVVADEVRKLAEQSNDAAQQIGEIVQKTQSETEDAIKGMEIGAQEVQKGTQKVVAMGDTLRQIIDIVEKVSARVQLISHSIRRMADNGEEIVANVRTIGDTSKNAAEDAETVSAATEQQTASIHEIANASTDLAQMATDLQTEVKKFKL